MYEGPSGVEPIVDWGVGEVRRQLRAWLAAGVRRYPRQLYGVRVNRTASGDWQGACVMGALEAGSADAAREFYGAVRLRTACPVNRCPMRWYVSSLFMHLNDDHHWTREAIVEYVAGIVGDAVDAVAGMCS